MGQLFTALIIDPETTSRMRLKSALLPTGRFSPIHQLPSLPEGFKHLKRETDTPTDIVFVSHRFDAELAIDFISKSKATPGGQDSAYILMISGNTEGTQLMAGHFLKGCDGFLLEPYSVEALEGAIDISQKVKKERRTSRQRKAIAIMLNDMIMQIDKIACLRAHGRPATRAIKRLNAMGESLRNAEEGFQDVYFECAIQIFGKTPVTSFVALNEQYEGASSRLKKIFEDKLIARLEDSD